MTYSAPTPEELREVARKACEGQPESDLHKHPAWRAADLIEQEAGHFLTGTGTSEAPTGLMVAVTNKQATDRIEQLERQMLAGLRALGIGCNSIDQCVSFEREVAGTVNVLEERMRRAEKQRDQLINKIVRWCEDPQHRRNRTLNQQCELLDQLRKEMLDISKEY